MTRVIKNIVDNVIQHDTKELSDLLMELRNDVDGESLDALIDLELLVGKFLVDEYENEQSLLPLIEERRLKLEASPASKSKLLRMKMLLDDINNNRRRIREIFQRIDHADNNEEDVWKMLVREGLISGDQFEMCFGQYRYGKDCECIEKCKDWTRSTISTYLMVKTKLLPILEELLHRGGIRDAQYAVLMQELDKL